MPPPRRAYAQGVALPARAKLNLDLEVIGRRPDGMHELRTRMVAVDLHDLLIAEPAEQTSLSVSGFDITGTTAGNTVLLAHRLVEAAAGRLLPTAYTLHKRIPPGSGLGGASSDAAAAMLAAVRLHNLQLDPVPLAVEVGADVTFFFTGGAALVEGAGERVTPIEMARSWFAIAWPGIELSTAAVYAAWDALERRDAQGPNQLRAAAGRVDGRLERFAEHLGDGWRMTGSGSAFFLPCSDRPSAERATEKLDCWNAVTCSVQRWA